MSENRTHGRFGEILAGAKPELRSLCVAIRKTVARMDRDFVEVVWPRQRIASYGVGPKKMTEHYAYVAVFPGHLNLGFYRGATLKDPKGILEGTGKNLRHVKLRTLADWKRPAVADLLRQAIADRKLHAAGR